MQRFSGRKGGSTKKGEVICVSRYWPPRNVTTNVYFKERFFFGFGGGSRTCLGRSKYSIMIIESTALAG